MKITRYLQRKREYIHRKEIRVIIEPTEQYRRKGEEATEWCRNVATMFRLKWL